MRQPIAVVAVVVLAASAAPAQALGLGEPHTNAVLGHPVDVRLPITGDGADALQPGCVTVEVYAGDNRLPKEQVRTALERVSPTSNDTVLHLRTTVSVDEPVVQLDVTIGCQGRLQRQYTLLPDPPRFEAPANLPQMAAATSPVVTSPVVTSPVADSPVATAELPPAPPPSRRQALPSGRAASAAPERVPAPRPRPPRPPRNETIAAVAAAPAPAPSPAPAASRALAPRVARAASAEASAPRRGPRLSLEAPQVALRSGGPVGVAAAATPAKPASASAVDALVAASAPAAGAADPTTRQMAESLARLKAETQAQREALARLEARLAQRDNGHPLLTTPTWMTLSALLAVALAGLAWRMRQQRERFERGWWDSQTRR